MSIRKLLNTSNFNLLPKQVAFLQVTNLFSEDFVINNEIETKIYCQIEFSFNFYMMTITETDGIHILKMFLGLDHKKLFWNGIQLALNYRFF